MDDRQIIHMLWNRLEQAIDALARKYGSRLRRTAMNILEDPQDAEEAVNDTYLALWNAIPPAKPDPLAPFVFRVGRNTALKRLRHRSAQMRDSRYDLSLDELAECIPLDTLEERLDARLLGQAIDRFLSGLSADNRALFLRRYWYLDSVRRLSEISGYSENNVYQRLFVMRQKLRDRLIKEGYEYEV